MRNNLMDELQNEGISTRPATHAVHMLSYYKNKYNLLLKNFLMLMLPMIAVFLYLYFME